MDVFGYTELLEKAEVLDPHSMAHRIPNGEDPELKEEVEEESPISPGAHNTVPAVTVTPVFPQVVLDHGIVVHVHAFLSCYSFMPEKTLQREKNTNNRKWHKVHDTLACLFMLMTLDRSSVSLSKYRAEKNK